MPIRPIVAVVVGLITGLFAVVAFSNDGDLDTSFGGSGEVSAFVGTAGGGDVKVLGQADGGVVLIGTTGGGAIGVTRLHADGSTDTSFGVNGKTIVAVPSGGSAYSALGALDAAGRIVAGGTVEFGDHSVMFVMRLTGSAQLDSTFNNSGTLSIARTFVTAQGATVAAIAVFSDPQAASADDSILVAGSMQDQYGPFNARNLAVVPLHADGSYFTSVPVGNDSFFFGGISNIAYCYRTAVSGANGYDSAGSITRRWFPDSSSELIAAGGNAFSSGTVPDFGVVVELDGSLHAVNSFGISGFSHFIFAASGTAQVNALTFDDSNRVLVAGIDTSTNHYNLAVGRIMTDGNYDTSFNGNGRIIINFDEAGETSYSQGETIMVQHDGRLLAGTQVVQSSVGANFQFGLVRLTADGAADPTFTSGTSIAGAHKYAFSAGNDFANSAGFTQGEKILLGGIVDQPNNAFGVLRATTDRIFGDGVEAPAYLPRIP